MPKVSIIVPVYNVEKYIKKCLDTLVNQTLKDIEIIIVNDGSTDDSSTIIEGYKEKYSEKIISLEKENGGLSDARNFGIKYATGEYIAFLDSDDYVETNMYEEMYNKAKQEKSDMVECDFIWEYPKKNKIDIGIKYNNKKEMLIHARVVAWNKLIKKDIIDKVKVEFPKGLRYEDIEFFYKLIPYLNKISFVKKPFVHYIQRENSISNKQNEKTADIFEILDNVINYYKVNDLYEEYKEEIEYNYARYLLCSSYIRMLKIRDRKIRRKLLNETWLKLNNNFPDWKKNKVLRENKNLKKRYMLTVNSCTYKVYNAVFSCLFRIIK